ncbi:hypothetical protein CALVIDRAFT_566936 [Calocera viscosa TUFC12733]|uniref:Uncharacterized protein n=1 Tax=Calocera viscosa (strain TUFC12733) TaxID=1330018 RepID=A0A167IW62_CALVF|nr:hypothetical protein CALVIDRAFT_566936 [Calocera viscosa TUFC12733]
MRTLQISPRTALPSLPDDDSDHGADADVQRLEQRVSRLERIQDQSPAQSRPKRPTKDVELEDDDIAAKRARGHVAQVQLSQLDDIDRNVKNYLQAEVRNQMYKLIGYEHGGITPSKSGPHLQDPDDFLVPDFSKAVSNSANIEIQGRATVMVLAQEKAMSGSVPEAYRERWLQESVLRGLAGKSWPNLKLIYTNQQKAAADGGETKNALSSSGLRSCRSATSTLDWITKEQLVHKDWMGECSCDKDGMKSKAWRAKLFATGKISAEDRDDPDIDVWEEKRPVWMHQKFWDWQKQLFADRAKKRPTKGKTCRNGRNDHKRIDLGRVSELMPTRAPYNCMLDPEWKEHELPKYTNRDEKAHYPSLVSKEICDSIVGTSGTSSGPTSATQR